VSPLEGGGKPSKYVRSKPKLGGSCSPVKSNKSRDVKQKCFHCHEPGHKASECALPKCPCGKLGHLEEKCPTNHKNPVANKGNKLVFEAQLAAIEKAKGDLDASLEAQRMQEEDRKIQKMIDEIEEEKSQNLKRVEKQAHVNHILAPVTVKTKNVIFTEVPHTPFYFRMFTLVMVLYIFAEIFLWFTLLVPLAVAVVYATIKHAFTVNPLTYDSLELFIITYKFYFSVLHLLTSLWSKREDFRTLFRLFQESKAVGGIIPARPFYRRSAHIMDWLSWIVCTVYYRESYYNYNYPKKCNCESKYTCECSYHSDWAVFTEDYEYVEMVIHPLDLNNIKPLNKNDLRADEMSLVKLLHEDPMMTTVTVKHFCGDPVLKNVLKDKDYLISIEQLAQYLTPQLTDPTVSEEDIKFRLKRKVVCSQTVNIDKYLVLGKDDVYINCAFVAFHYYQANKQKLIGNRIPLLKDLF
jgi:hypothetical protein